MRLPLLIVVVPILLSLAIDLRIYVIARRRCQSAVPSIIHIACALLIYIVLGVAIALPTRGGDDTSLVAKMWLLFTFITVLSAKAVFVLIDFIACIPQLFRKHRWHWLSLSGAILAVITFLAMWWGALVNRFNIDINEVTVTIPNLPQEFDGYRIVQISDLHVGTYGRDTDYVDRLVETINSIDANAVVFTGDIVNRTSHELEPFVCSLSRLQAVDGVYSILGNHDYGDYYDWSSDVEKQKAFNHLVAMENQMGWKLLRNTTAMIHHGGDSIAVIGVENVGDPPFKVYGNLKEAYPDLSDSVAKILLTHNPAHWEQEIADKDNVNVGLTLSGHTHAMQMSIGHLSPAVWRYNEWGGLYTDSNDSHPLYVNIGIGTVGMPMRLGATPEITIITLRR